MGLTLRLLVSRYRIITLLAVGAGCSQAAAQTTFPEEFLLSELDGTNGTKIIGASAGDFVGRSVANAGDLNGDSIDDIAIGASGADADGMIDAGITYVVYGRSDLWTTPIDLSNIDGTNGFAIYGAGPENFSGVSVAGTGDVNGDNVDDLIIGASGYDAGTGTNPGGAFVVFGKIGGPPPIVRLNELTPDEGFAFEGAFPDSFTGVAVAGGGDVNNDGHNDVLIGSAGPGEAYLIFGRPESDPFPATITRGDLDGVIGAFFSSSPAFRAGRAVAIVQDFNGDDFDDIVIGDDLASPGGRTSAGAAYIIDGRENFEDEIGLDPALVTIRRLEGQLALDSLGGGVASAGDVNGDGLGDILISALSPGANYLLLGNDTGAWPDTFTPDIIDGENGGIFLGNGRDDRIVAVAGVGDVNRDGLDDFITGASFATGSAVRSGVTFCTFGKDRFAVEVRFRDFDIEDGFAIFGEEADDLSGLQCGGGGDFNDDGNTDILIGSPDHDPLGLDGGGAGYVVWGGPPDTGGPCRADLDGDGLLTIFDFLEFQNLFSSGDLRADFDGDLLLTFFDFLVYQNEFAAGCP